MNRDFIKKNPTLLLLTVLLYSHTLQAQTAPITEIEQLTMPGTTNTLPFYWQGDTVNGKWEPHSAMLIPVKLNNCAKQFYMQFDLGAPNSLFYKNKLAAIQEKYPGAIPLGEPAGKLTQFTFRAGKTSIQAKEIAVKQFDSSTINWRHKKSIEIIGTIGADLVNGKVAIIDYPNRKLTISETIPEKLLAKLTLTELVYMHKKILIPATINGRETVLYFDTGSSMFSLLTDKKTADSLAIAGSVAVQSRVRSWNRVLTANSLPTNHSIVICNTSIPIRYVTHIEGASKAQVEQMMKLGIGGMTGNKLFLEYQLVLDTKNKRMGIVTAQK